MIDPIVFIKQKWVNSKQLLGKLAALHHKGQPVLVGTVSIEKNEVLSRLLTKAKIPHQLLKC